MSRLLALLFVLSLTGPAAIPLSGQPAQPWWKNIRFVRIPMNDTLSTQVPCIETDKNNLIWTGRGMWLCAWDDEKKMWLYDFFVKDNLVDIALDKGKDLFWIVTEKRSLIVYDRNTKAKLQTALSGLGAEAEINRIWLDPESRNQVWICSSEGLFTAKKENDKLRVESLPLFKGMDVKRVQRHNGRLIVATANSLFENAEGRWVSAPQFDKRAIYGLAVSQSNERFIAYNYDKKIDFVFRNSQKIGMDSFKHFRFYDLLADDFGRCWGAVNGGLYAWADAIGSWHYFHEANADLRISKALRVIQDNKGNIWVGAPEGLYKIAEMPMKTVTQVPVPDPQAPFKPAAPIDYKADNLLPPGVNDIHLILVLDISGSMQASIHRMGVAFNNILKNLRKNDHVTIISYASKVQVELENASIDTQTKRQIEEIFNGFNYKGGTNIRAALAKAYALAKAHRVPGGNNRIIIVSDANFDVPARYANMAEMAANGFNVSIFCSQKKSPPQHKELEKLAQMGRGTYFNFGAGNGKSIEQAFWEELTR